MQYEQAMEAAAREQARASTLRGGQARAQVPPAGATSGFGQLGGSEQEGEAAQSRAPEATGRDANSKEREAAKEREAKREKERAEMRKLKEELDEMERKKEELVARGKVLMQSIGDAPPSGDEAIGVRNAEARPAAVVQGSSRAGEVHHAPLAEATRASRSRDRGKDDSGQGTARANGQTLRGRSRDRDQEGRRSAEQRSRSRSTTARTCP